MTVSSDLIRIWCAYQVLDCKLSNCRNKKTRRRPRDTRVAVLGLRVYVRVYMCMYIYMRVRAEMHSPHSCTRVLRCDPVVVLSSRFSNLYIPEDYTRTCVCVCTCCVIYIIFIYICKLSMAPLESSRMPSRIYTYYYANCRAHSLSPTRTQLDSLARSHRRAPPPPPPPTPLPPSLSLERASRFKT